jgi:hypothetical protein
MVFPCQAARRSANRIIASRETRKDGMRKLFHIWLLGSAMGLSLPGAVDAQSTFAQSTFAQSTFDGIYGGLPEQTSGGVQCPQLEIPGALLIGGGTAHAANGGFLGTVDATGHVVLQTRQALRFEGQIDPFGLVRVTGVSARGCTYVFSWRKR